MEKRKEGCFYLTLYRSFSERTITVECSGKEDVLKKVKDTHTISNILGPATLKEVFRMENGEKNPYQFIYSDDNTITDIIPA